MKPVKPKLEANWRQKSLERLEKAVWPASGFSSSIVERGLRLRKIPLGDVTADDVRFLLSQQMGFPYTLELALDLLRDDLLLEAGYYPGDLLDAMLKVGPEAQDRFACYFTSLASLLRPRMDELRAFRPRLSLDGLTSGEPE